MCSDDDRGFSRLHDLHQMLPDPREKTTEIQTHYITLGLLTDGVFMSLQLTALPTAVSLPAV